MPVGLMDMFRPSGGYYGVGGTQDPQMDFGGALAQRQNSLIGMGLGLLSPMGPGSNAWSNALGGYTAGSRTDAQNAHFAQQAARQKAQDAFQRSQAGQAQSNWERQFARGDMTDAQRAMRDVLGPDATPEQKSTFMRQFYMPKIEGEWDTKDIINPNDPEEKITVQQHKRTGEYRLPQIPGVTTGAAAAPTTTGAAGAAPSATQVPRRMQPITSGEQTYTPPTGLSKDARKEWEKEVTKLSVQRQIAADTAKRAGASIDPVGEDIDRAINQISEFPKMTTGAFATGVKKIPIIGGSSQAGEVESLINTVKANSSLEKLQQMRAQSPTGASGLGQVTQGEHKILQDAIGSLDQSQDANSVLYNLERIKRIRHEIVHGPGTAPQPRFAPPSYQQTPGQVGAAAAPAAPKPGFQKGGYVFKGGDPSDENNWAPVRK